MGLDAAKQGRWGGIGLPASSYLEDEESHDRERDQKNGQNQTAQHERNQLSLPRSGLSDAEGADECLSEEV